MFSTDEDDFFPNIKNRLKFSDCSNAVKSAKGLSITLGRAYLVTKYSRNGYTVYQAKEDCEATWRDMKATEQVLGIYENGIIAETRLDFPKNEDTI